MKVSFYPFVELALSNSLALLKSVKLLGIQCYCKKILFVQLKEPGGITQCIDDAHDLVRC